MIFEIRQTTADGRNNFEVTEAENIIYRAETNFFKPFTLVAGVSMRTITLKTTGGIVLFRTHYDVSENLAASVILMSYIFGNPKKGKTLQCA